MPTPERSKNKELTICAFVVCRTVRCARQVLRTDIFLCRFSVDATVVGATVSEFMEHARMFVFETYCRIHRRIDLGMLAGKLNMPVEAAEKWVVELIGVASLNAKIDCSENHVLMTVQHPSMYVPCRLRCRCSTSPYCSCRRAAH